MLKPMKRTLLLFSLVFLVGSCALFTPRIPYRMGMSEGKFLRQNRDAVISQLNEGEKVYRVNQGDRFYILATFVNGELTDLEEKELVPAWPQQKIMDPNNPNQRQ